MWELRPSVPLLTCTRLAGTSGASSAPNWGGPELALKGLSASSMIEKKRWRSRNSRDDRISWPFRSTTTSSAATEMAAKKPSQKPRSGGYVSLSRGGIIFGVSGAKTMSSRST